jgi:hypothetical protein
MGYYVTAHGTVILPRSLEGDAVNAVRMLNYQHEMKRGRRSPKTGDPFADHWFAWMPERYHEDPNLRTVGDILEMVGFEVQAHRNAGLNVYTVTYDNKTGQEEVFLNVLADYAQVEIEAVGEDGERWKWVNVKAGAPLEYHTATITYGRYASVSQMVESERRTLDSIRGQYV